MLSGRQHFEPLKGGVVTTGSQDNKAVTLSKPFFARMQAMRTIADFRLTDAKNLLESKEEVVGNQGKAKIMAFSGSHNAPSIADLVSNVNEFQGEN